MSSNFNISNLLQYLLLTMFIISTQNQISSPYKKSCITQLGTNSKDLYFSGDIKIYVILIVACVNIVVVSVSLRVYAINK